MKKVFGTALATGSSLLLLASTAFAQEAVGTGFKLCPSNQDGARDFSVLCGLTGNNAISSLLTLILIIAVIVALFYLIWGGIKWITSGGDKGNVETARNHIVAAIIGLIVVFLSWFILNFILEFFNLGGVNTEFRTSDVNVGQE